MNKELVNFTMKHLIFAILVIGISKTCFGQDCYYWREYNFTIPSDAFVAGKDLQGGNIYVGQVHEKNGEGGLVPVQINPNSSQVYAEMVGVRIHQKHIKILCGNQGDFKWIPSNHHTLRYDARAKNIVIGGHEDNWEDYLIGRVKIGGEHRIGKIIINGWGDAPGFHFVTRQNNARNITSNYEFLVYEKQKDEMYIISFTA